MRRSAVTATAATRATGSGARRQRSSGTTGTRLRQHRRLAPGLRPHGRPRPGRRSVGPGPSPPDSSPPTVPRRCSEPRRWTPRPPRTRPRRSWTCAPPSCRSWTPSSTTRRHLPRSGRRCAAAWCWPARTPHCPPAFPLRWQPGTDRLGDLAHALALLTEDLLAGDGLGRIRRWCSSDDCGNRDRARRHYSRTRRRG
ncbi:CGNR zinc finger domain-containing protein [Streptomyces massasporeus]|uniref:CGNR zinc finger domain-containing protein n=1 Tax=Streptomyces massasporeus TaxID=67324 RepID=UPI003452A4FE